MLSTLAVVAVTVVGIMVGVEFSVAAFDAIAAVLGGDETATEVLWSALHGMSLLERSGRMRPEHRRHRIAELTARFSG